MWLDGLLRSYADDLTTSAATGRTVDRAVARLLEDDQVQHALRELVADAAASVRASLTDAQGALPARVARLVADVGRRAASDPPFTARLESWLERGVGHAVEQYGDELTALIRRTVAGWDDDTTARRIELAVGRDLQFIRINGTLVGALAGVAIHAVALAVG